MGALVSTLPHAILAGMRGATGRGDARERPSRGQQLDQTVLDALRAAARRHRPAWLGADSDDIAHRAYEKLRPRLEAGERLSSAYLRRTAYTVCIDLVRSERAEQRRREDWGHPALGGQRSPEALASAREVAEHISDCVAALPDARRRAAVLYLQGHGATEIASLLHEPYKRVENLVYRALAALRKCLGAKGVSPP